MKFKDINENDYNYDGTNVNISKKNFRKVSKDYKNSEKGKERMVVLDPKTQATVSVPVKFTKESSSPWTSSGKHPEIMNRDELEHEIDIFKQQQQIQQHLSPGEIAQLDSLYYYLEQLDAMGNDDPYEFNLDEDMVDDLEAEIDKLAKKPNKTKAEKDKLDKLQDRMADISADLDEDLANEAIMNDDMIDKLRVAYEPLRGKKIAPEPLMKIFDKIDSNKDFLIQMYREDIPFVSTMAMSRLMLKHGMKADEINNLREAGYEGQSEPTIHYFEIGNEEVNCDKLTQDITSQGVKAFCELDGRNGVVKIHTYSPARVIAMTLDKAGVQAKEVKAPVMAYAEDFTRKDFDDNEAENHHAENSLEVLKKFGTPKEYEEVKQIYRRHMRNGSIEFDDQKRRNELVNKYLAKLELTVAPRTMDDMAAIDDYRAKKKALQDIQMNKYTAGDDELKRELMKKKMELSKRAKELGLTEDYSEMTKKLIQKLIVGGKSDAEIQARTGESGKRIEIIRRNITVQDPDMRMDPNKPAYIVKENDSPEGILAKYPKEWEQLKQGADIMDFDELYQELFMYFSNSGDMPYGTQKARDGDPYQWVNDELDHLGLLEGDGRKKGMHPKGHPMRKKQQAAIHANEDVEDETKIIRLNMMQQQVEDLKSNFEILIRLDQRGTGAGDLTDQITTMNKAITALADVLDRSKKIVPETVQEDEYYPGYVLSYRKEKGDKPKFIKKATLKDLQDEASKLRKDGYSIGKMGRMRKGDMSLPKELTEGPRSAYDVDPKLMPYVKMGQKIASALEPSSGLKWDDVEFNKAAALGSSFGKLGSAFGPKTPGQALKDANVDVEMAKAIIAKVKAANIRPGAGVKDPEREPEMAENATREAPSILMMTESEFDEAAGEKDACYRKVKSRYKVWPSAYASGALAKCRKVGAANWGNKDKK